MDQAAARKALLRKVALGEIPWGGQLVACLIDEVNGEILIDNDLVHEVAPILEAALEIAEERGRLAQQKATLLFLANVRRELMANAEGQGTALKALARAGSHALLCAGKLLPKVAVESELHSALPRYSPHQN